MQFGAAVGEVGKTPITAQDGLGVHRGAGLVAAPQVAVGEAVEEEEVNRQDAKNAKEEMNHRGTENRVESGTMILRPVSTRRSILPSPIILRFVPWCLLVRLGLHG